MKWTKEHYDYILSICNSKPVKEILALFNEHFNENITFSAISNAMYKGMVQNKKYTLEELGI